MAGAPVIIITGASSGIGEAAARIFGGRGYRVVLAARRAERLEALAAEIRAAGGEALPVAGDVSKLEDIQRVVEQTLAAYGQIDVLFNNAGFGRLNWLERLDPQEIEAVVNVNLLGAIQMARAVLPTMIAQRRGHIINMSSVAGLVATPTYSIYSATKYGLRGFTEALRREVGIYGVHVSGIYPGGTKTEFSERAGIQRKTKKTTPAALRLEPEQVAEAVWRMVQRPSRSVVMPWIWRGAAVVNAAFPWLMDWLIEWKFVKPERL